MFKEIRFFLVVGIMGTIFSYSSLYGFFPINLFRPYDINLRPPVWCGENIQWTSWFEIAYKARAYGGDKDEVTQLWTLRQDALAMLKGFDASSPMTKLLEDMGSPEDNGTRGNFIVHGDFKAREFCMAGRYHLPCDFTLSVHVPIYDMELKKVKFIDQTPDTSSVDMTVKTELTDVLIQRVHEFDPNLNLSGWHRTGFGDVIFLGEWNRCFPQGKPVLKNVALDARVALQFPTGVRNNLNDILSVPFGGDGAVGIIFGGGIDLTWYDIFRGGIDVEFINMFGNTRYRRIKVDRDQTDFLLLAKTMVYKDFGFTHRFNLYLEGHEIYRGLSVSAIYQFWKHGDDSLSLCSNVFSTDIANSAQSLQEWTMHHMIFKAGYDFQCDVSAESSFKPQISLFYKLPFNGKRAILCNTFGAIFTLNF